MTPAERHNKLAPELAALLIAEAGPEAEAMVILESVIVGVLGYYNRDSREAFEVLLIMADRVADRLYGQAASRRP